MIRIVTLAFLWLNTAIFASSTDYVVMLTAPDFHCPYCDDMLPVVETFTDLGYTAVIVKDARLSKAFGVSSYPTFVGFSGGSPVTMKAGVLTLAQLKALLPASGAVRPVPMPETPSATPWRPVIPRKPVAPLDRKPATVISEWVPRDPAPKAIKPPAQPFEENTPGQNTPVDEPKSVKNLPDPANV